MEDEEDDSHYCLKCRRTIIGLNNYVKHRTEGCQDSSPLISANDFFLSLNLVSNQPEEDVLCSSLLEPHSSHKKLNLLSFLKDDDEAAIQDIPDDLSTFIADEDSHQLHEYLLPPSSTSSSSPFNNVDQCPSCRAGVQPHQIGKHLISHYHHHHQRGKNDNEALILKYISEIVKEAPYQCSPCQFYCNWHHEFILHWKNAHLLSQKLDKGTRYWCSFCRFRVQSGEEMHEHLNSSGHMEIVAVINRSVPIIVRKSNLIPCEHCNKTFRLRIALKKHCMESHPTEILQDRKMEECEFCSNLFFSSDEYRDHVLENHYNLCSQCPLCGLRFSRSQDLGVHVRNKACGEVGFNGKKGSYLCKECPSFDCDTLAMLRFHSALKHTMSSDPFKVTCPVCNKTFPKTKLWQHLKVHDPDKSRCNNCYRIFLSSSELLSHSKNCHSSQNTDFQCSKCPYTTKKRLLRDLHYKRNHTSYKPASSSKNVNLNSCSVCEAKFQTSSELRSHYLSHTSDKPLVCSICGVFKAKRISEINRHQRSKHGNVEHLKFCSYCSYSTISSQHLKRHVRTTHTTNKDLFQCRFCSFKCATIENLRKHILKTKIHPEETFVYYCDYCTEFKHNSATEYGKHLSSSHQIKDFKNKVKNYFSKEYDEVPLSPSMLIKKSEDLKEIYL